jgi:hypothetical protein
MNLEAPSAMRWGSSPCSLGKGETIQTFPVSIG